MPNLQKLHLVHFGEKLVRKFPENGKFPVRFSGNFGENCGEIFPEFSRRNFFTLVYRAISGKCPKIPGEIPGGNFPVGKFPGFPEILPTGNFHHKFHHNITNKLYLYNGLQPVNQTFTKFVS